MFVTIITDCFDENARARQITRASSLMNCPVSVTGVRNDIEASGNLIDVLDASEGRKGVVIVNVAPRTPQSWWIGAGAEHFKERENGTPFGFFWYKDVLVVSTIDGYTLSLAKKIGLVNDLRVLDLNSVVDYALSLGLVTESYAEYLKKTQFRSYDFAPRVALWLLEGRSVPSEVLEAESIKDIPPIIWFVDNFGNCKTSILGNEIGTSAMICHSVNFSYHPSLKDVPPGNPAVVTGSSGINAKRFAEIVIQGGNAAKQLDLSSGDELKLTEVGSTS